MKKHVSSGRTAAIVLSVATAMSAPGLAFAGPGCKHDQRMYKGYYPHAPMAPRAGYARGMGPVYYPGPGMHNGWMAAPYPGAMAAPGKPPGVAAKPAAGKAYHAGSAETAAAADSAAADETVTVRISGMRFEPASLTVKPGTTVKWVHQENMPHTVTGSNGSGLRSNTLQSGQTYSYTFSEPGRFDYVCSLHPSMKGSVTVEQTGTDT